jgi:hypothetical protein
VTLSCHEPPLRPLPIDVRPAAGERAELYIRRLARANHLRPSYLRRYLAGPPKWDGKIDPQRLAALTGRPAAILQKTLTASGWPQPARPPSGYLPAATPTSQPSTPRSGLPQQPGSRPPAN